MMQPPVAVDPPSRASENDGRPIEEVHRMRHDLAILSAQLSAMQHNLIAGPGNDVPAVELDNLTVQELRAELRRAQQENERLRAGLALEQQRRQAALDALMNRPL
ncbi:g9906 [Coccomyxa elongata]